ncbi:deazaflavin-dependent nitroreductase [Mycobacterium vulneris]|uniref:nitroreductase family deazaflavin-dependent oxidoreductase n=1 Tax=Mycolicibacterium porcinum TaxID=39693 RepID=UPI00080AFA26|nr:nitroreductase family deazaflavin-dependent oxidoreductase [Mycolicibacterium porcinum]MBX8690971.1 nitroreductase family deazaflavin-dependent oxidoreductase [Mycobacterium sp. 20091114027_K0903767]OCB41714.1 deazaflavin-dependent nitroreductase [Mycolicibacterium vulneris]OCB10175.1 deazaflavin-dependent nitroreductase [Mycolicibacterium porcinum]OCB57997.1 deazaflavin-dependent nitroreductase [Mycolicibacterium vulneris]OCB65453.1 deazaflavin-dependent nitroreductase [Mycolicibacterium v
MSDIDPDFDKGELVADAAALGDFNRNVVEEFRANGGKVGGPFEGADLLLLHTTGAKSGQPRLSPLAYLTVDGKMLIVGSYAGAPKDPAWVHNLRANPKVRIEVGTESYDATARELPDAERDAAYPKITEAAPVFAEYQANTTRSIPLFEIIRT